MYQIEFEIQHQNPKKIDVPEFIGPMVNSHLTTVTRLIVLLNSMQLLSSSSFNHCLNNASTYVILSLMYTSDEALDQIRAVLEMNGAINIKLTNLG